MAKKIIASDIVDDLEIIETSGVILSQAKDERDLATMRAALELKEYAKKLEDRDKWCNNLLWMIRIGFAFSMFITIALGMDWLNFEYSAVTVPVAIGAGFLETYGLAKIAVNYLFDGSKMTDGLSLKPRKQS